MASPTPEILFIYSLATGAPLTGLTPTFSCYKDETGSTVSQPSITEISAGVYKFTPTFGSPSHGIIYIVNCGATANPPYIARYMRPEDYSTDNIATMQTQITTMSGEVTTMSGEVATMSGEVTTMSDQLDTVATDVATMAPQVNTTNTNVATMAPQVLDVYDMSFGEQSVHVTGPDATRLVVKRPNTTVLKKFNLTDQNGDPAYQNVTTKTPIP